MLLSKAKARSSCDSTSLFANPVLSAKSVNSLELVRALPFIEELNPLFTKGCTKSPTLSNVTLVSIVMFPNIVIRLSVLVAASLVALED